MKRNLFILIILSGLVFMAACRKKDEVVETNAKIIGSDMRLCACCGGWWFDIQGDTLRAMDLPADFIAQIDQNAFPIPVLISWDRENLSSCLMDELVHIKTIRKP
jgi:hypothetical protein